MSLYDWERCTHEGIGQPGCSTCDPSKDRCMARAVSADNKDLRAEGGTLMVDAIWHVFVWAALFSSAMWHLESNRRISIALEHLKKATARLDELEQRERDRS